MFGQANLALSRTGRKSFYRVDIVSTGGGLVRSSSGVEVHTRALGRVPPAKVDTLLITGAEKDSVVAMLDNPVLHRWVPRCALVAARFGSVCSGTFILAALGLLDGRRVTSHWDACEPLAQAFPVRRRPGSSRRCALMRHACCSLRNFHSKLSPRKSASRRRRG